MEVDLLHSDSPPAAPDTILWFEFLLDPNLLKQHLCKTQPDPSATELIVKFLSVVPELEVPPEPGQYLRKHLALKILALKIAAFLRWNLDILESKLPPQTQAQLLQDLVFMATDGAFSIPPQEIPKELMQRSHVKFALILYHRWMIRFSVTAALQTKSTKAQIHIPGMAADNGYSQMNPNFEKILRRAETSQAQSIEFLSQVMDTKDFHRETMRVPIMETFVHLCEDSIEMKHNWHISDVFVTDNELFLQINYDLCSNYFFYAHHDLARNQILKCKENLDQLKRDYAMRSYNERELIWEDLKYASVSLDNILGYIRALNLGKQLLGEEPSLLQQMQESISKHYSGIIGVLQADNLRREIPIVYRNVLELDIHGSSSSGIFTVARDLLNKVSALNAVRTVLEGELPSTQAEFNNKFKTGGEKYVDLLFWAFSPVLLSEKLNEQDWERIRNFFQHLTTSQNQFPIDNIDEYLRKHVGDQSEIIKKEIFADGFPLVDQLNDDEGMELPPELLTTDWDTPDFNRKNFKELEIGCLMQRLIDAATADDIRKCLVNLAVTNPSKPLWKVNPQWQLPIPINNVVMSLPRGFLQDFSYILLGKARQYAEMGDHKAALDMLTLLESETRGKLNQSGSGSGRTADQLLYKLCKLVGWEALLMHISQCLNEWPNHKSSAPGLINKCKMCLMSVQSGDSVIPRMQILEECTIWLVNCGEWDTVVSSTGGTEVARALAAVCLELGKNGKNRTLWDIVVQTFCTNSGQSSNTTKRNNSGNPVRAQDYSLSTTLKQRYELQTFLNKLRDPLVITVMCSLLAKIFNILNDDSHNDLCIDYQNNWPTSIANPNNYQMEGVIEVLNALVLQGLKYYPNNIPWIKLYGDLNSACGNFTVAIKQYLSALTIISDYFVHPLTKQLVDDQMIFKKMIKCCQQLNCHTQAAILCQFLDEVDYALAFKHLSERSNMCMDAMDSYYGCIWDTTILEYLINLHHKRGEMHRKQIAIKVMGLLELNSNNNEEIQREAMNSRKSKFMRALVKQYIC